MRVTKVHILTDSADSVINVTTPLQVVVEFLVCQDTVSINNMCMAMKNIAGAHIFDSVTECSFTKGMNRAAVQIPGNFLNDDTYLIDFYFAEDSNVLFMHHDCLMFKVNDIPRTTTRYLGKFAGAIRPELHWDCTCLAEG